MRLIPQPKIFEQKAGCFDISQFYLECDSEIDSRAQNAAKTLRLRGDKYPLKITVVDSGSEGYKITANEDSITVLGESAAGAFYGIMTLRQILSQCGEKIPQFYIEDKPDYSYRAFYHDITRGRVLTVEGVKRLIDRLAALKYNSLQLYVEHTFEFPQYSGINEKLGYLTADEIREIDGYARENFIDFVPSLSSFGHLYELLQSERYRHLCELEDYKPSRHVWVERMAHHTIDANNPESERLIFSLIDKYLPLFSSQYFNICCDETFDLAKGRNKGCDAGELYFDFVGKIVRRVQSYGKKVMMWGDVFLQNPKAQDRLPKDVILLNWNYETHPSCDSMQTLKSQGLTQIVCPATSGWNRFGEDTAASVPNISTIARYGKDFGAYGFMLTNWGDYGHTSPINSVLYGMTLGGALSWNTETALDADYDRAVSRLVYGSDADIPQLLHRLAKLQKVVLDGEWDGGPFVRLMHWDTARRRGEISTTAFTKSEEEISKQSALLLELHCELENTDMDGEIKHDLCLMARGAAAVLSLILYLQFKSVDSSAVRAEIEDWFADYRVAWCKDSKTSEVDRIRDTLLAILEDKPLG